MTALATVDAPRRRGLRKPPAQQRMWTALRILKSFDVDTLAYAAGARRDYALCYLRNLVLAGYVTVTEEARPRHGHPARYRVVRRSGLLSPRIRIQTGVPKNGAMRYLYDPNDGKTYNLTELSQVTPTAAGVTYGR